MRTFFAPGRVNLIGEHTDYTGGLALPAALELGVRIEGEASDSIELTSPLGSVDRYATAVAEELAAAGWPRTGFKGRISSTVPIGTGLSSSAALEVAIALALCAAAAFELPPVELAQVAQRAEHRASGVPCGILDQAASILGRAGHAVLLDTGTLDFELVRIPEEIEMLIADSGERRKLEDTGYADRRREVEAGHERRLRHIRNENERVRETVAALRADPPDLERLGRVFAAGQASLRDDFEVSTPGLGRLVERALEAGAFAARQTGGGFGGSIVALVEAERADRIAEAIRPYAAAVFRSRAGEGARELDA